MDDLRGKRLLILGATGLLCRAVELARQMGIYTVVTDYYPNSPAKQVADKSYDVSTTDIDALEQIAREERIDGVFTGFSDVNLYSARALCDRLGLPFYATKEQLDSTTNKLAFKDLCRKYGVPTVKQYPMTAECRDEDVGRLEYPVIVKPADSYASKGCSVCRNSKELCDAVQKALPFSKSKQIIVEKYMVPEKCDDVVIAYLFVDGAAYLEFIGDRYTNTEQAGLAPLAAAIISPSKYAKEYIENVDKNVKEMFSAIGVKNGRVFIQSFHDEDGFYFYEMGFRLSGGEEYVPVWEEFKIDEVMMLIQHALTGKMSRCSGLEPCTPLYKNAYCNLVFLCSAGTIARIEGLEEVRKDPRTVHLSQLAQVGDTIAANGTLGQVLCRVYIKESSQEKLSEAISEFAKTIIAYDEHGEKMMLHVYGEKKGS